MVLYPLCPMTMGRTPRSLAHWMIYPPGCLARPWSSPPLGLGDVLPDHFQHGVRRRSEPMLVPHPLEGIGQNMDELRLRSKLPRHLAPPVHLLSCSTRVHTFLDTTSPLLGDLHGTLPRALSDHYIIDTIGSTGKPRQNGWRGFQWSDGSL